jgi:hypothetical protein
MCTLEWPGDVAEVEDDGVRQNRGRRPVHGRHSWTLHAKDVVLLGLSSLPLAGIATPALAVALSPVPVVIALVLLVHNDRPRASSLAYLVGRSTALAVLVTVFIGVPRLTGSLDRHHLPRWTEWLVFATGAAFVGAGVMVWHRRDRANAPSQWHRHVGGIAPAAAAALGLFPPLANPNVLAASMAAGAHISALSSAFSTAVAGACYIVIAGSTVAVPIAVYLALGPRIDPKLEGLRRWVQRHQSAATAATLIVVGVTIAIYGLV